MSPPTSTLSYISAETSGPGGEVLRAGSLTQTTAPSLEAGRGARPRPRLAARCPESCVRVGPPLRQLQVESGEVVCAGGGGGGGPSTPPGTPGRARDLGRFPSRGLPSGVSRCWTRRPECAGRGRGGGGIRAGGGEPRALPPPRRGARASPGPGHRVGWGPRAAPPPRPVAGAPAVRAAPPPPPPPEPPPGTPPPSLRPAPRRRPSVNPFPRGRRRREGRRDRERGGPCTGERGAWEGEAQGAERNGPREEPPSADRGRDAERRGLRAGRGRRRGGRAAPRPGSGSRPPPRLGQSPDRRCPVGEVWVRGGGGWSRCPPHPPPAGLICLMPCG